MLSKYIRKLYITNYIFHTQMSKNKFTLSTVTSTPKTKAALLQVSWIVCNFSLSPLAGYTVHIFYTLRDILLLIYNQFTINSF